jgi:hypothetical protein
MQYVVKDQTTKEELCQIANGSIPQINSPLSIFGLDDEFIVKYVSYELFPNSGDSYAVVWVTSSGLVNSGSVLSQNSIAYWNHVRATEYFEPAEPI